MRMAAPATAEEMTAILKAAVHNAGGNQRDLARHLGCSQQHVSLMLTGQSRITVEKLLGILDWVGMSLVLMEPDEN